MRITSNISNVASSDRERGLYFKSRGFASLSCFILALLISSGCEYEWRDEPPVADQVMVMQGRNSDASPARSVEAVKTLPKPQSEDKAVLAPGKDVSGQMDLPPKAKRIDLTALSEAGGAQISANVASADLALTFDEREDTLSKSEGVNPYKVSVEFSVPRTIKAIRVLSSYSDYSWACQIDGGERLFVDTVIDGQWSTISWSEGVKARKFTVEVLRKHRDNFVHLNEVEVYE
jgi:hypothetical protein